MVPKADSGTFLLLFLLVLSITEPLRPGTGAGAGLGLPVLPPQPCGRVPGPELCERGGRRGSPGRAAGLGERPRGLGALPASGVPGRSAPGGRGAAPVPVPSRRAESGSGAAAARRRSRGRGWPRSAGGVSAASGHCLEKRRDAAESCGGTALCRAGWLRLGRAESWGSCCRSEVGQKAAEPPR